MDRPPGSTESDRQVVERIFAASGETEELASESDLDYFTGLTGSGPAFPSLFGEAMIADAVNRGISLQVAERAVKTMLVGVGRLLEGSEATLSATVDTFLDYRGTTAAAILAMREAGLNEAVRKGLAVALEKSKNMARNT